MNKFKCERIGILTKMGLSSGVIAERLGLRYTQVYTYQIRHGFREVKNPRKKEI